MEEREEREEKALLLTEQEAIIKWQYTQSFSFVWVGFQRVRCMHQTRKSKLVILFLLDVANYQPCLNNPIAKELFWPGSYTHSLAQLLFPPYPLAPAAPPVDFS